MMPVRPFRVTSVQEEGRDGETIVGSITIMRSSEGRGVHIQSEVVVGDEEDEDDVVFLLVLSSHCARSLAVVHGVPGFVLRFAVQYRQAATLHADG